MCGLLRVNIVRHVYRLASLMVNFGLGIWLKIETLIGLACFGWRRWLPESLRLAV